MDTIATNSVIYTKVNLVDERKLIKQTDVEQNGDNGQNTSSEQVLGTNTSGSHIEAQTVNVDDNAQSLIGELYKISTKLTTRPKRQTRPQLER